MQLCDNLWVVKKPKKAFVFSKSEFVKKRTHNLLFTPQLCNWLSERLPLLDSAFTLKDPAWQLLKKQDRQSDTPEALLLPEYRLLDEFEGVRITTSDFRGITYLHIRYYKDSHPTRKGFAFTQKTWPFARDHIAQIKAD